eukprot:3951741-Pyramimonas_sp.AAC.1
MGDAHAQTFIPCELDSDFVSSVRRLCGAAMTCRKLPHQSRQEDYSVVFCKLGFVNLCYRSASPK